MKIKQFEIWVADLNPRIGTEPGKVRPVVIVQTDLLNSQHPSTIVCPVTTNIKKGAEPLRIHLRKAKHGLEKDGDIIIDQVRAIDNKRLMKRLGTVDRTTSTLIKANLRIVLDLD